MNNHNIIDISILRKLLRADFETGILFWLERPGNKAFNARFAGKEAFTAFSKSGYKNGIVLYKHFKRSRMIFALYHGKWPKDQIDHINHNRSDDRISNLREVTAIENMKNYSMPSTNRSGVCGVSWHKKSTKWQANISVDGKLKNLGHYHNKEAAISARLKAEIKYRFHPNHGT